MDRAERTGFGVAVVAHAVLFAALSLNLLKPPELPKIDAEPIEVSLVDKVALESSAPEPVPAAAPASAEPAPVAPRPTPTPPPLPLSQPKPSAKPPVAPKQAARPEPTKAKPSPARPTRRPGLSRDLVTGLSDAPNAAGTPAKTAGPAVASSIGAEVRRQLKPYWKPPTGADAEMLRTTISVHLNRDGSILGSPQLIRQTGVNESNRGQARLHVDQAIKAVRLAAPFKLPAEYYDAWREIQPNFDARLAQ